MEFAVKRDENVHLNEPLRCPVCGAALNVCLLDLEDEDLASKEMLLLLDCPQGHVHATLTHDDITAMLTAQVRKQLGL